MPPVRSNSGLRSPEHRPLPFSHSRHPSQAQSLSQTAADVYTPSHSTSHGPQQLPPRSTILTPPVKEEPRNPPPITLPSAQPQAMLHTQLQHPQRGPPSMQNTPPPATSKPAAEPRKSNLMSLLNDTDPEEPRRKKPSEQGPPSHSSTPLQAAPIAPPPSTTQSYPSSSSLRRPLYEDSMAAQSPYTRPYSYAQQSTLPNTASNRPIDLTDDKPSVSRPSLRDNRQSQQSFHRGLSQTPQLTSLSSTSSSLPQPPNANERMYSNHRSVFASHNTPRQNPTPPPLSGFNNSPNPHSRTSSISGPPGSLPRHGIPSTTAAQHAQALNASSQILQPNPYAQVDPPGSGVPPPGPMGMRPSPHLSTSHIAQQHRDSSGRNEHSQASNANLSYSNPQTPNEHPAHPFQGLSRLTEPYRPRDSRDAQEYDPRHSDRDTSRELSQRTEYLREQLSNPALRATGPPMHEDMRFQPQDRGYLSQRSHTPLSRSEHGQPPPLQHPPHSSLGVANHSLYGQRPPEEPQHRFLRDPRDRSMTDRIREEQAQAQHQAAMNRDEHMRRETERDAREREIRERDAQDAHIRNTMIRGRAEMRGPPPPQPNSGPGSIHDPRPPTGPIDWASGVRHLQDRGPWQR
jgi:serine/arginine repetitive matrix protein 2